MQKVSVCIFSVELLLEQTGAGTRPQATRCTLLWEFQGCLAQAGRGIPWGWDCQGGMKPFLLLDETSWLCLVALLQGEARCHGTGATCCAAGSILTWAVRCGHPRVKLGAKPGEVCLFWKVSLSQSLISTKGTHPKLPLLLLYLIRPQLTTLVLGAGNSVIRAQTLFWILKASCFYSCQNQSFRSPPLAAVLSCELIATPGQVNVGIILPGANNIDFQGKEGVSASWIKSCVWFMILSSVRKKCSITLPLSLGENGVVLRNLEYRLVISSELIRAWSAHYLETVEGKSKIFQKSARAACFPLSEHGNVVHLNWLLTSAYWGLQSLWLLIICKTHGICMSLSMVVPLPKANKTLPSVQQSPFLRAISHLMSKSLAESE